MKQYRNLLAGVNIYLCIISPIHQPNKTNSQQAIIRSSFFSKLFRQSGYLLVEKLKGVILGLFTKIKKRSGTSFCCTFSAWFFHKNVLYLTICQLQSFDVILFFLLTWFIETFWKKFPWILPKTHKFSLTFFLQTYIFSLI